VIHARLAPAHPIRNEETITRQLAQVEQRSKPVPLLPLRFTEPKCGHCVIEGIWGVSIGGRNLPATKPGAPSARAKHVSVLVWERGQVGLPMRAFEELVIRFLFGPPNYPHPLGQRQVVRIQRVKPSRQLRGQFSLARASEPWGNSSMHSIARAAVDAVGNGTVVQWATFLHHFSECATASRTVVRLSRLSYVLPSHDPIKNNCAATRNMT
jgi:hypothetical protein